MAQSYLRFIFSLFPSTVKFPLIIKAAGIMVSDNANNVHSGFRVLVYGVTQLKITPKLPRSFLGNRRYANIIEVLCIGG